METTRGPASELGADGLLEIFEGDRAMVVSILQMAIESIKADAERIYAALPVRDADAISEAAHRMKGTCGNLRADHLRDLASSIQYAPKGDDWTIAPAMLDDLRGTIDRLSAEIEAFANHGG